MYVIRIFTRFKKLNLHLFCIKNVFQNLFESQSKYFNPILQYENNHNYYGEHDNYMIRRVFA